MTDNFFSFFLFSFRPLNDFENNNTDNSRCIYCTGSSCTAQEVSSSLLWTIYSVCSATTTMSATDDKQHPVTSDELDVFGQEDHHDIKYKRLSWPLVAILMIAEIVSNGLLSLPSSLAVVGMVPGLAIIVFLGVFATYTSWLLVEFKLRHPEVHTMGDAGYIMFGPLGREIMSFGTCCFAIFACGGQLLAGQIALASLSDNKLCSMLYTGIFAMPTLLCSLPRTFHGLSWVSIASVLSIFIAGIVGMGAAGISPDPNRTVEIAVASDFYTAFVSITNPVFSFAGHFMWVLSIRVAVPFHAIDSQPAVGSLCLSPR